MEELLRDLVTLGIAGLLCLLRLGAATFSAAEYDEPAADGRQTTFRLRIGWYLLGFALIWAALAVHPAPIRDLQLGLGDRFGAVLGGLALGAVGTAQAVLFARLRYARLRMPPLWSYPGAVLNALGTAFIDEVTFRGAVLGFLVLIGLNGWIAIVIQALIYGLATRLGAPGRDRSIFLLALLLAVATGWATIETGGIGAAFLGHTIARFAMFLTTGHAGQPLPEGREVEEIEKRRRPPDGWSIVGAVRDSISRDR